MRGGIKKVPVSHVHKMDAGLYEHEINKSMLEFKAWQNKEYPRYYVKQITERHQKLNNFRAQYCKLDTLLIQTTMLPFLLVLLITFYQIAYLKYLSWFSCVRIGVEFLFTVMAMWHLTTQSERLNHCNEIIRRAVYQSQWYKCSPEVKKCVCLILRDTQQLNHLSLLNGFIVVTNGFNAKVFKAAFSFINFMKITGLL
uniref:Odorant receptor n=1 Tax=Cacopsylla melanoneura TaxID=428564 RepID=A0A8D8W1T4_9HEMI